MKKTGWAFFLFLVISIGLYPLIYILSDMTGKGLLASKDVDLLASPLWQTAFYGHIVFGGLSLLAGATQFSSRLRVTRTGLHRLLGLIYLFCVSVSGICAIYLAINASGGFVAKAGFFFLGIFWLISSWVAFLKIREHRYREHGNWMIRSYSLAFAAVMLRIYMPFFGIVLSMPFESSYPIIAWICWVPNLIIAEWIIHRRMVVSGVI